MDVLIGIDIGGTQLRAAVYPNDGSRNAIVQKRIPTRGKEPSIDRLLRLIADILPPRDRLIGIAAAVPGPTDPSAGLVISCPNIPGWEALPLRKLLHERFNAPAAIGNDANLAALGEWRFGAARGHHYVLYFTFSTGIGGGVIMNDELLLGSRGLAAELGHVTICVDGPICSCGKQGHLEAVASGTGIANYVKAQLAAGRSSSLPKDPAPTAKDVSKAALQGDELAVEAMQRAGRFAGIALANYLHIFNPTIIIMGGGVSSSGEIFLGPVRKSMEENVISKEYLNNLTLTTAQLGDDAGLLGALALAGTLVRD